MLVEPTNPWYKKYEDYNNEDYKNEDYKNNEDNEKSSKENKLEKNPHKWLNILNIRFAIVSLLLTSIVVILIML